MVPLSHQTGVSVISQESTGPAVVVVADGDVEPDRLASLLRPRRTAAPPWIIAADGAAAKVLDAGFRPDVVIGDGDSLSVQARARLAGVGVELRTADPDKDESDTELCLLEAMAMGASVVSLIGALGGDRPEHAVANLLLLADARFDACPIRLVAGNAEMTRIGTSGGAGAIAIEGRPGDFVSLLPLESVVEGVRTSGLRFPLDDERLIMGPARGLSNELLAERATVTTRTGRLLVVHTITPDPATTA